MIKIYLFPRFWSNFFAKFKFVIFFYLNDFIKWMSSADPIARKIRSVVIGGDLIDGVGVFPNQDKVLEQMTTEEQLGKMCIDMFV